MPIPAAGAVNGNLRLFRLVWARRRDDFVYGSGHGGARLVRNSRSIEIQFSYSCGSGHSRLCHFLDDAGARGVGVLFLGFLMQHTIMMTFRQKQCSPV
jgi:hypothetical protein